MLNLTKFLTATTLFAASAITFLPAHAEPAFANTRLVSQKDAKHTQSEKGVLTLGADTQNLTFAAKDHTALSIPYGQITSMHLDQTVSRIHTPFAGRVEHEQFLTLIYQDGTNQRSSAVFHLNGRSYRELVAALEAKTSKQVTQSTN